MLKQFLNSNYRKVIALAGATVLSLFLIYNLSISKTINLYQAKKDQERLLNQTGKLSEDLKNIDLQLEELQASSLKAYDKKYILEKVTDFCRANNLLVVAFPSTTSKKDAEYEILTNEIVVKGDYNNIVELIYLIERTEKVGSISNIKFEMIKDKKTKKEELIAKIVIRNLAA